MMLLLVELNARQKSDGIITTCHTYSDLCLPVVDNIMELKLAIDIERAVSKI